MATTNLGRVSFVLKGTYDAETAYKRLDVVTMNHTSYAAKRDTTGHAPPDETYWQPIADVTAADEAAALARAAASNADAKAALANTAAGTANAAAGNADTKAGLANDAATAAVSAAALANSKAALADDKAALAAEKAGDAEAAAGTANAAASNADAKAALANTAAGTANTAAGNANDKAALADEAADDATEAAASANAAAALITTKRYGATWTPGQSSPTLTRAWDAVGLVAAVGTDIANQAYNNDFDLIAPFTRRLCCGDFDAEGVMQITAYMGEPSFATDGSKGNVWVECPIMWYIQDIPNGILGVAPQAVNLPGWKVHPLFERANGGYNQKVYLPAYSLGMAEGVAKSISGLHPYNGSQISLTTAVKTYNTAKAHLETFAARHYEWLLFTVEFATFDCQSVMCGAGNMPYADDKVFLSATNTNFVVVTATIGNKFTAGQSIYLGTAYTAQSTDGSAYNVITDIVACDDTGTPDESGTYRKITFDGTARDVTAGSTAISSRPWITGACDSVKTPSGSPCGSAMPSSAAKYPCRYRYRENAWGNIYSTLIDVLVQMTGAGTEESPYVYTWYILPDITKYANGALTADYVALDGVCATANGYIKAIQADATYPQALVPTDSGGSSATYYCDYLYIVNTSVIRAVRVGGNVSAGPPCGLLSMYAHNAPSISSWPCGGGLYFNQS